MAEENGFDMDKPLVNEWNDQSNAIINAGEAGDMSLPYEDSVSKTRSKINPNNSYGQIQNGGPDTIEAIIETSSDINKDNTEQTSDRLLSKSAAFINLCKCFSGASLFAMPWAFGQSGLLSGSLSLIFLAFLTYFTLFWLGKCSHLHPTIAKPTYPDIAYRAFGKFGFYMAWIGIICMTVGVCGSYLVFIGSQLSSLIKIKWLTQTIATAAVAIPIIFLALFRSYSFLVPFNVLGLISLFAAAVIVVIESSMNIDLEHNKHNVDYGANSNVGYYPLFLGNAAFAYLIHSVILPIEESMRDRQRYTVSRDYTVSLRWSVVAVTLTILLFSGYAYLAYGEDTCGNIMNNLNEDKWYTKVVIIALCINLFFTYPLFLFPMTETLEMAMFGIKVEDQHKSTQDWKIETKRNILRVILVIATGGIAIGIPDFELITGLTGAFGNNVLGLILPPIMYFRLAKYQGIEHEINLFHRCIGYFSTSFGIAMLIICTYTFVYSIIKNDDSSC